MIPFNRFASTITLALTLSVGAQAQSTNLEKDVESYFLQALNTQLTTEVVDRNAFTNATGSPFPVIASCTNPFT